MAPASKRSLQPLAILGLTVVWVGLWGSLTAVTVLGGVVVSVLVCLVFPLPPLAMGLRVHPIHLLWLVLHFLLDVVQASIHVAWTTLQLHRQPRNAVIEVDLHTQSDFILTVVAELTSLVPGSLVVEARRSTHSLFLHVLDARDDAGVERMRAQTFALERRVLRAFGDGQGPTPSPPDPLPQKEAR